MANRTIGTLKTVILRFPEDGIVNKKYYLPRDSSISNAIVRGLQIVTADQLSSTFSYTGLTSAPLTSTQLGYFTLTLVDHRGDEVFKDLVPWSFTAGNNNGQLRQFMNHHFCLEKCYVKFQTVTSINKDSTFIQFDFLIAN